MEAEIVQQKHSQHKELAKCELNLKLDSGGVPNNGLELEMEDKWLEVYIFALDFDMLTFEDSHSTSTRQLPTNWT